MIAAAAALFAACAQNDVFNDVDTQDVPIGFGSEAVYKATRAVEGINLPWFQTVGASGSGNRFGVYGFKNVFQTGDDQYKINTSKCTDIFENEEVWCSDKEIDNTDAQNPVITSVTWSHSTIRFWDKSAVGAYNFYAYAPYATSNLTYNKGAVQGTGADLANKQNYSPTLTFSSLPLIAEITDADCNADKMVAAAVKNTDYTTISGLSHTYTHTNAPTVAFTFKHILSKLSFKVVSDIAKADETNGVATFTVKEINIDFPQANNVQDVVTFPVSDPTGAVTYRGTPAKDGTFGTSGIELVYKSEAGFVVPSTASASNNVALEPTIAVAADANNVASKTYIVTPINGTVTAHSFDVKVTYDVNYAGGTSETNCIATGTVTYSPTQNQYYVVVIKINPAQIEFCVEGVSAWDLQDEADNTFQVR